MSELKLILKEFRTREGEEKLTEMAARLGVTSSLICHYSAGRIKPNTTFLYKMTQEYGLSKKDIIRLYKAAGVGIIEHQVSELRARQDDMELV